MSAIERREAMPKDEKIEAEEPARGFAVALQQIDDGCFHAELSETLQETLGTLEQHADKFGGDAKGTITVTLALKVSSNGVVNVAGDVKTKLPKAPRAGSVFWLTKGNNLSPSNPRQQQLPLRVAPAPAAPIDVTAPKPPTRAL